MRYKAYYRPETLAEAEQLMAELSGPVCLIAGGTDVMIYAREDDRYHDASIVDILCLPELSGITLTEKRIRIGAGMTHTEVEQSPVIQKYAGVLAMACRTVGSLQIRNRATLAGNVCNASPAADSLAALAVLDAEIEFRRNGETHMLPLYDAIERPYQTVFTDRDIVTAIHVRRLQEDALCHFYKLGRRKALAISRMTIATVLHMAQDGTPDDFCITVGATFPRPAVFPEINAMLLGKRPDEAAINAVAQALSEKIPQLAGIRKSTAFKQPVCRNMTARILKELLLEA